jgi:hypothetical protein
MPAFASRHFDNHSSPARIAFSLALNFRNSRPDTAPLLNSEHNGESIPASEFANRAAGLPRAATAAAAKAKTTPGPKNTNTVVFAQL